jgi:hypothetical protein
MCSRAESPWEERRVMTARELPVRTALAWQEAVPTSATCCGYAARGEGGGDWGVWRRSARASHNQRSAPRAGKQAGGWVSGL